MMNNKLIGISGFARSGKDTFYERCKQILCLSGEESKRYSFADELKNELNELLVKYTGISSFTENNAEKEIVRPLLVTYGTDVRLNLNQNCWIEKITEGVDTDLHLNKYVFITDVRFLNEAKWIKSKGGILININREGVGPANNDEQDQYELFKHLIDHKIFWPTFEENYLDHCNDSILDSGFIKDLEIKKNLHTTV